MSAQHRPDDLAQLRAEVAALRARVAPPTRRHIPRRFLPLALVALLVALLPLSLRAATPFTDLDPAQDAGHNPNIELIFNAGITQGCGTPTAYCPKEAVTREQMASFLARTAGLGANPPVVNAKTAQTVPDGSVTAAKLSPSGATAGQVLTATGSGVAWQDVATGPAGPQGIPGAPGPQGPAGPAGTPAARVVGGAVNANGTSQLPGALYTVAHNAATHAYTITFPAGTFATPPASGSYPICAITGFAPLTGLTEPPIASNGSATQTVTFNADTIFNFVCVQQNLP